MAKSKSTDHSPIRAKIFASQEEILQAIAKLQGRISQVEELAKDGLPYRDALRVTTEVQIKETIREIFGEHSPEFRIHQHHRIKSPSEEDIAETCAMIEGLIENLEDKQRSFPGGGASATRPAQPKERPAESLPSRPAPPPVKPGPVAASSPPRPQPVQSSRPLKPVIDAPSEAVAARAPETPPVATRPISATDPLGRIRTVCLRFHAVARQIRQRHEARPTLDVEDHHDVMDLLHALLRLDFEDVRVEPWASADDQNRTALLLERDRIAIMVKKTRAGFGAKEIADQVTADFQHAAAHPECTTLFCFVYDPDGRIGNPRQLETQLKIQRDSAVLEVLIAPK